VAPSRFAFVLLWSMICGQSKPFASAKSRARASSSATFRPMNWISG
jgi:hypothetical protein